MIHNGHYVSCLVRKIKCSISFIKFLKKIERQPLFYHFWNHQSQRFSTGWKITLWSICSMRAFPGPVVPPTTNMNEFLLKCVFGSSLINGLSVGWPLILVLFIYLLVKIFVLWLIKQLTSSGPSLNQIWIKRDSERHNLNENEATTTYAK